MSNRVFITGIGTISAIGNSVNETLQSLLESKSGIGKISILKTLLREDFPSGEIRKTNDEMLQWSELSKDRPYSRTCLLGFIAAREAIQMARLEKNKNLKTGFISATSVGGMDRTELFYDDYISDHSAGRLRDIITHDCGESTRTIAENLQLNDFTDTLSTACSSSANAIMLGARMIKHGLLDCVVAGGTDALSRFTLNGFNSLMILDKKPCQSFDDNRRGLNLGEGAGYVVLESEKNSDVAQKEIFAEVSGYSNTNDAYHQTASSPEAKGAVMAMSQALQVANLLPTDIDYVNAHGTGTPNNDLTEETAFKKIFGAKTALFSSTKGFTGHTLAAAGGIEAVFSLLAIKHGIIFPNLRYETKMKEYDFGPVTELKRNVNLKHVMSNSFGFGGNNTCLIFSKV